MTEYARRTARVLLFDGAQRLLLFCYSLRPEVHGGERGWFTPGGGVDAGEELRETAARELAEEIGLVVPAVELGAHVAYTSGTADLGWQAGLFRDDFFVHRVEQHDVDLSGLLDYEKKNLLETRWWTATELAATTDIVYPLQLSPLVDRLLRGDAPSEPIELPWHH